ncbi:MAG: hypothetical protein H6707_09635 [Deltaproteobacteria bacterium]|nr:hypothetical protein [Deltaproteobacteria bacterium]
MNIRSLLFATIALSACTTSGPPMRPDIGALGDGSVLLFEDATVSLDGATGADAATVDGGARQDGAIKLDGSVSVKCGNGKVDTGEKCDTAIASGSAGACPTSCNSLDSCKPNTLVGAGTCQAHCAQTTITACTGGDGCCPSGCTAASDSDCVQCTTPGASCTAGGKSGKCHNGTCCTGCINGSGQCDQSADTTSACGSGGGTCQSCSTSLSCRIAACKSGQCDTDPAPLASSCSTSGTAGKCYHGSCCTGCWDGIGCVATPETKQFCVIGGGACASCNSGDCCDVDGTIGSPYHCRQPQPGEKVFAGGFICSGIWPN